MQLKVWYRRVSSFSYPLYCNYGAAPTYQHLCWVLGVQGIRDVAPGHKSLTVLTRHQTPPGECDGTERIPTSTADRCVHHA